MKSSYKILSRALVPAFFAAALLSSSVQAATDPAIIDLGTPASADTRSIEDVVITYKTLAEQIGSGVIKLTPGNVKTATRQAADEVLAKGGPPAPLTPTNPNRAVNKADELGELAAFILGGIDNNNAKFTKLGIQKKYIVLIAKGILKSSKTNPVMSTSTTVFRDVAGSLALTIANNSIYAPNLAKLQKFLGKKAKSIAGKAQVATYQAGNTQGFNKTIPAGPLNPNSLYEDGSIPTLATTKDPETDQRNA